MLDWGLGQYETTARALEPVSAHVIELARITGGERVLDVGCGTGNAALLAARAGAEAVGVDPAERLVSVARARASADGLEARFVAGQAESLPFDDASFDVVLSVFGVIFAADPERAIAELLRVVRPTGRVLIAAWLPAGTISTLMGVFGRAMAAATGTVPRRFAWHDPDAVAQVATRHDAVVDAHEGAIRFEGESPETYFATEEANHPMSLAFRPLLEQAGLYEEVRREGIAVLRDGNEDAARFCVTSPYRVVELRPQ